MTTCPRHDPPRCYLTWRELPRHFRPAHVYREPDATVLVNDPRATRLDLLLANLALLNEAEHAVMRAAYDAVLDGQTDRLAVTDDLPLLYVPPPLRLPGEANLQGGQELLRRHQAGLCQTEIDLVLAERRRQTA